MRCMTRRSPDVYMVQLELGLEGALDSAALGRRDRLCWIVIRACAPVSSMRA